MCIPRHVPVPALALQGENIAALELLGQLGQKQLPQTPPAALQLAKLDLTNISHTLMKEMGTKGATQFQC